MRSCLVRSERTHVSRGKSGSLAMRLLSQLVTSRSSSLASRHPLPPRSGWRRLNPAWTATGSFLLGHLRCFEWHLMAFFPGFFLFFCLFGSHPADSSLAHGITVQF